MPPHHDTDEPQIRIFFLGVKKKLLQRDFFLTFLFKGREKTFPETQLLIATVQLCSLILLET
jgi:hypothetical protein